MLQEFISASTRCDMLEEKLERCLDIAEVTNRREALFEMKETDYSELHEVKAKFLPFRSLWSLARKFFDNKNRWLQGPLIDIDREQLTKDIEEASIELERLAAYEFRETRQIIAVVVELKKLYDDMKPYLPLVQALRSPFLKARHWVSIQKLRDPPLEIDSELTQSLEEIVDKSALMYVHQITEISIQAEKQKKREEELHALRERQLQNSSMEASSEGPHSQMGEGLEGHTNNQSDMELNQLEQELIEEINQQQ